MLIAWAETFTLGVNSGPSARGCSMHMRFLPILVLLAAFSGCGRPETIEVDLTTLPVRFIVDHQGWPRPFWWPRVTEFAVASEEDGLLWQVESSKGEGELADRLAFIYGQPPPGYRQVHPVEGTAPKSLISGRSYFVAATGPKDVYRVVFALPQRAEESRFRHRTGKNTDEPRREPDTEGFFPANPSSNAAKAPSGG